MPKRGNEPEVSIRKASFEGFVIVLSPAVRLVTASTNGSQSSEHYPGPKARRGTNRSATRFRDYI